MTCSQIRWAALLTLVVTAGCGGNGSTSAAASGGQVSLGGATATATATTAAQTTVTGGLPSTGGTSATGGVSSAGGAASTGGASAAALGGTAGVGGSKATGGNKATGGSASATGGSKAVDGTSSSTGGARAGGGTSSAPSGGTSGGQGSSQPSGGSIATGGSRNTGGSSAMGGTQSTGGGTSTGGTRADAGGSTHSGVWRVMPLGDSITGTTCYPQLLSKSLIAGGHTNFTFVGTVTNNQSCGTNAPNVKSEGHGGYLVTDLVGSGSHAAELQTWVTADDADMVLMHFGTNDVWGNQRTTTQILNAYTTIVAALRAVNKNVVIVAAQIIPLNPSTCTTCDYPKDLNAAIPAWAQGLNTAESPIYVVDLHSVFNPASIYAPNSTYTADGVHPNQTGAQMMADKMYSELVAKGYF